MPGSVRNAFGEVRHRGVDYPHASVQPLERIRMAAAETSASQVRTGPQRDLETVTLVAAWLRPRGSRGSYRALGSGEPQSWPGVEVREPSPKP